MRLVPRQVPVAVTRRDHPLAIVWIQLVIAEPNGVAREVTLDPATIERELTAHYGDSWQRYRLIDPSELPSDRRYRNAWRDDGASIVVDLELAKTIHRQSVEYAAKMRLRELIPQILEALADERTEEVARLRTLRRRLDAAHTDGRIDAATSLDELAAIDPVSEIELGASSDAEPRP